MGSLLGLVAGLGSQILVASFFGAGSEMDAFLTALAIPIYLEAVLLGGLSFVFIPAFIAEQSAGREEDAWALVGTFFWLTFVTLALISTMVIVSAPLATEILAPGMATEKSKLVTNMLRTLIASAPFAGLSSLTLGIENARGRFFLPAASPAIGTIGNIVTLVALYPFVGAMALAWAYLVSVILSAAVTIVPVCRHGWPFRMPIQDKRVVDMVRLVLPFVVFGVLTRATPLVERYFASGLADGNLSYLGYATKIAQILDRMLGTIIATALFPVIARTFVDEGVCGLIATVGYGFRLTCAVALPTLAIVSAVTTPLIVTLFERGAFDSIATAKVGSVVPIVITGTILFQMVGTLLARVFYVTKDTRTVPITAAAVSVLYILLSHALVREWAYIGLAAAQTIYVGVTVVLLAIILQLRMAGFWSLEHVRKVAEYGMAAAVAFAIAKSITFLLASTPSLIILIAASLTSAIAYLAILYWRDREIAIAIMEAGGVPRVLPLVELFLPSDTARRFHQALTIEDHS